MKDGQKLWIVVGVLAGAVVGAGVEHARVARTGEAMPAEPVVRKVTVPVARASSGEDAAAGEALRRRIAELEQADALWRQQNAELQGAIADREAELAQLRDRPREAQDQPAEGQPATGERRDRRQSFEARLEQLRTENPEAYAEMQKRRDEFRQRMEQRQQERKDFLAKVDTARMSEEQRANHEQLLATIAQVETVVAGFRDGERREHTPEQHTAMRQTFETLGQLYDQERQYLLEETGRALGEDGTAFAEYVQSIYDNTSMSFGMGRGRGGPGGRDRPPAPTPQGAAP